MKNPILPSEITPKSVYLNRRRFIKNSVHMAAAAYLAAACSPQIPGYPWIYKFL
jgi:hypothetical protein